MFYARSFLSFRSSTSIRRRPFLCFFFFIFLFPGAATFAGDSFQILSSEFCCLVCVRALTNSHTHTCSSRSRETIRGLAVWHCSRTGEETEWWNDSDLIGWWLPPSLFVSICWANDRRRRRRSSGGGGADGCGGLAGWWGGMSRQAQDTEATVWLSHKLKAVVKKKNHNHLKKMPPTIFQKTALRWCNMKSFLSNVSLIVVLVLEPLDSFSFLSSPHDTV